MIEVFTAYRRGQLPTAKAVRKDDMYITGQEKLVTGKIGETGVRLLRSLHY